MIARSSRSLPAIAAWILLASTPAGASTFGETVSVSPIGRALSVEVASPGMTREVIASCVRLTGVRSDDGIATLQGGSLALAGSGAAARIVVTHPEPVFEPILRFTLQDICSTRLQRTYTLLMPEPLELARPAAREPAQQLARAQPSPRPGAVAAAPVAQLWTTVQGESVASIAQAMYPRDEGARRAFINGVVRGNPEVFGAGRHPAAVLPAGTELRIPGLAGVAAASTEARRAPRSVPPAAEPSVTAHVAPASPAPPAPAPAVAERDRLVVDTGARDELADREASDQTMREARLVAAIDRSIDAQLELLERIRRLEELQIALRSQIEATEPDRPVVALAPRQADRAPETIASTAQASTAQEEQIPVREGPAPARASSANNWLNWTIAGGLLALALLLLLRRRSADAGTVHDRRAARTPVTEAWPDEAPTSAGIDRERADVGRSPGNDAAVSGTDWRATVARAPLSQPLTEPFSDSPTLPPVLGTEVELEEHESAVELADIMLSFGRINGAAETLEAFIESNPKQAVMPWLKLMEVYHTAGMEREFETLATELNKTFNVRAVTWQNFHEVSSDTTGIESLPHITAYLEETWGTPHCQAYVDTLVRDNRQGTRLGFELGALDDLLMLAGVLEQQFGRYKPKDR